MTSAKAALEKLLEKGQTLNLKAQARARNAHAHARSHARAHARALLLSSPLR
jgi:hypothetical protein